MHFGSRLVSGEPSHEYGFSKRASSGVLSRAQARSSKTVDNLSRLECFKRVGQNRYVPCYPTLHDKNPSLSTPNPRRGPCSMLCRVRAMGRPPVPPSWGCGIGNPKRSLDLTNVTAGMNSSSYNCCSVTKLRKRKGERPAEGVQSLYHYDEVPKLCLPEPNDLRSPR